MSSDSNPLHPSRLKQELLAWINHARLKDISDANTAFIEETFSSLGFNINLDVQGNLIDMQLCAGFPVESIKEHYLHALKHAIQKMAPGFAVNVDITSFIQPHRTQLAMKGLRGVKNTIAIASGKGGVGKSTVTVNTAIALARSGARVGILDADIYGPSIPLMLGKIESLQQQGDHLHPAFVHGIYAMSIGYLVDYEEALIWRGPMLAKSLIQLLNIAYWDDLDYLLIDLPPGTGDIQLSLVQKIPLTGAVIVTTPQTIATADAQKAIKMFEKTNINCLGLIENMAFYECGACGHHDHIFGYQGGEDLSKQHHIPFLGRLPLSRSIQEDCENGKPTALDKGNNLSQPWMDLALNLAFNLSKQPLNYAEKFPEIRVEHSR